MDNKRFGLKDGDLETIISVLRKYPEVEQAIIFGSRAMGNYRPGSDVDIVLRGFVHDITRISFELNEDSLLPYKFDVLDFNSISNRNLVDHIKRVGIVFYEKRGFKASPSS